MTPVRLLAIDLDGTLLDSKWNLPEANRHALEQAHRGGVEVVFVTGRRYHITHPITATLGFPHYVITTAGAVTRSHHGERIFARTIQPGLAGSFLSHIRAFRSFTFLISDEDGREDLACEGPQLENVHVARYVDLNANCMKTLADLESALSDHLIEVVLIGHLSEMTEAVRLINTFPARHQLKVLRTEYIDRDLCLLDIIDARTDKGLAVRQLAKHLGISRNAVMAIGDNHSDLDMLRYAAYPVVMANATEEVKAQGWPLTSSNDEDGVARAVGRYILGD